MNEDDETVAKIIVLFIVSIPYLIFLAITFIFPLTTRNKEENKITNIKATTVRTAIKTAMEKGER
jgi:hypothetical protein